MNHTVSDTSRARRLFVYIILILTRTLIYVPAQDLQSVLQQFQLL